MMAWSLLSARMARRARFIALVTAVAASSTGAQAIGGAEHYSTLRRARDLVGASRHAEALPLYERLTTNEPRDGTLWFEYAGSLEAVGRRLDANRALEKLLSIGASFPTFLELRIARNFALSSQKDSAFSWLERALAHRLEVRPRIATDSGFASLRSDERFARIAGTKPSGSYSRDDRWKYDLDYLVGEAQRLHVGFEREAFADSFGHAAARLRERITSLSDDRIMLELRRLLVMLGDGHTNVFPTFSRLPVDFYLFSDGLFIIRGLGEAERLVGARVLAIGRKSAADAMRDVVPFVSRDNDMGVTALGPALLGQPIVLQAIGASDDTAIVELTVRNQRGSEEKVSLRPIAGRAQLVLRAPAKATAPPPLYLRDTSTFWLEALPDSRALYVQYNAVAHAPNKTTEQFSEELKRTARERGAVHLIVDVRNNGGGNTFLYPPLLNAIIHFRESSPDNRVWVITGRRTFSAAQNFVTTLTRYVTDAVVVGEPTGSRPNFVGESPPVILPFSGLRASISSRYHQNADFTDKRMWIAPSVPTPLSSADYFSNRDPALQAILELIARPVS